MAIVEADVDVEMERNAALGMSLRDYFAGQALAGMCVNWASQAAQYRPTMAKRAYELADAMLAARGAPV